MLKFLFGLLLIGVGVMGLFLTLPFVLPITSDELVLPGISLLLVFIGYVLTLVNREA